MTNRLSPHGLRALTAIGVSAAGVFAALVAAPPAEAVVTRVGVMPDINFGFDTNYGTGCSHTVEAILTEAVTPVTFYDNGVPFATVPPSGGVALVTWVPSTMGLHTLRAVQGVDTGAYVQVEVGEGVHVGYGCLVRLP